MFTQLKNRRWGYMFLTAVASLALATLATLFTARSSNNMDKRAHHEKEQTVNGRYTHHNGSTIRFIN